MNDCFALFSNFERQTSKFLQEDWLHCVKSAKIQAFHDPYFPLYARNRICIIPYLDRFSDSVQIRENTNMTLSIFGKILIKKSWYFGIFYALLSCAEVLSWFDLKVQTFRDIEIFHQISTFTSLQLRIIIESITR